MAKKKGNIDYKAIGKAGEDAIYYELVKIFGRPNVFRNVYVSRKSGSLTELDLVALHPTGVYVIESKNYAGMVQGDGVSKDWVQFKSASYRRTFYSPVRQNQGHIDALREGCAGKLGFVPPMLSVIVFPDTCQLRVSKLPPGLRCCSVTQMNPLLESIMRSVKPALTKEHYDMLYPLLRDAQSTRVSSSVKKKHMKDVCRARNYGR